MKTTVSIDVERELLTVAEQYAAQRQLSLAQLVESFFQGLNNGRPQKNVVQLLRELEPPTVSETRNLTEAYFEEQKSKHGF